MMTRRNFLWISAGLGAGAAAFYLPQFFFNKSLSEASGTLFGGGRGIMSGKEIFYLSFLDLDQAQPTPRFLPLSFLPHGVSFHPSRPHIFTVFEKKGPGACEINLNEKDAVRSLSTSPERYFYGHGVYSPDAKFLYSTETILDSLEGVIVVRDAASFETLGTFPSYGASPHDCQLVENGTVLAITNGGGVAGSKQIPCVSYVELSSQKLLAKYEMLDPRFNTGHLVVSSQRDLVVASAPRLGLPEDGPGAISLLSSDGTLKTLELPPSMKSHFKAETLSLCLDEKNEIVAATSPAGNSVTFWSLNNGKLLTSLELENPRGIVLTKSKTHYAISHGPDAGILQVSTKTLKPEGHRIAKAGFSGSHLYLLA